MPGQNDEKKRVARRQIKRISVNTSPEPEIEQIVIPDGDIIEEKIEETVEETVEEIVEEAIEETIEETVQPVEEDVQPEIELVEEPISENEETPEVSEEEPETAEPVEETVEENSEIEIPKKMENPEANSISIIRIGVVLLLVCAIVTLALSLVNFLTEGRIADNKINAMNAAVKEIFPNSTASQEIEYVYSEPVAGVYKVMQNDSHIGYAVSVIPSGFGGDIEMLVGIDHRGEVSGVRILALSETPNVGSKVAGADYLSGYDGKTGDLVLGTDIDAISGATVSSRAVLSGVNAVLALELKVEGVVEDDEQNDSDITVDLTQEFPVDSELETNLIPSDSVPPVSYETVYREETSPPATEPNETSIIEMNTDPVETTAEPDETSADDTSSEDTSETAQPEETSAPDETSADA